MFKERRKRSASSSSSRSSSSSNSTSSGSFASSSSLQPRQTSRSLTRSSLSNAQQTSSNPPGFKVRRSRLSGITSVLPLPTAPSPNASSNPLSPHPLASLPNGPPDPLPRSTIQPESSPEEDEIDIESLRLELVAEGLLPENLSWEEICGEKRYASTLGDAVAGKIQLNESYKVSKKGKGGEKEKNMALPRERDGGFTLDLSLTPEGDIPVDIPVDDEQFLLLDNLNTLYSASPHPERLSYAFAQTVKRAVLPFLVTPYPLPPCKFSFTTEDLQKRALVLYNTVTPATVAYFGTHVAKYLEFCDSRHIPLDQRFPASPEVLSLFLCSFVGVLAGSTIRKYHDGMIFWHAIHQVDFLLPNDQWKRIIKGCIALEPDKKEPRPPATFTDLLCIREKLDLTKGSDACLWAAATVAFFAMARPGDVTVRSHAAFNIKRDPDGTDIRWVKATADFPEYAVINLPYDKVLGKVGDTLIVVAQTVDRRLDPLWALRNHLSINSPSKTDFLFSSLPHSGLSTDPLWCLTYSHFTKTINAILVQAGRCELNGHSWRIGGATFYLLADVHPDMIKVVGRWRSDAFLRYWRKIKILAAKNLSNAQLVDAGDANEERVGGAIIEEL